MRVSILFIPWRTIRAGLAAFVLVLATQNIAAAEQRLALVIGNSAYAQAPLENPVHDARAMSSTLERLGFEVISLENGSRAEMERTILSFSEKLKAGGTGLFYYAGHGVQARGRNFLIPVDAHITSESALRVSSIDLGLVLEEMDIAGNRVNFVILDACRNNPFQGRTRSVSRGLAVVDAARGTLIAYATSPGSVAADGTGGNGLYTQELLRALDEPGLKAEEVFKHVRVQVAKRSNEAQIPWESSSLTGDFVFNGSGEATTAQASPSATPARADREALFWESIRSSNQQGEFQEYLKQFPSGMFAGLARYRIKGFEQRDKALGTANGSTVAPATKQSSNQIDQHGSPLPQVAYSAPIEDTHSAKVGQQATQVDSNSPAGNPVKAKQDPRQSKTLKVALLPFDMTSWGAADPTDEDKIIEAINSALAQSGHALELTYSPYSNTVSHNPLALPRKLWERRVRPFSSHPNEGAALKVARKLDVDAVLLCWYQSDYGGPDPRPPKVEVFLAVPDLGKMFHEKGTADNVREITRTMLAEFIQAHQVLAASN